eukprot:gnl/MRDRNA2_/MRDRNA2_74724_c0_seq1.p1 gnl/MRDRNA2_/MRDRNA2_74724_c0~~gnl/MRDRNA2_/MRDRNA2_74724_c0_seq1.p1  ORF type:complete len:365 (+),score=73.92 gnl/MRDRNA2_/MRDRNA2_74724_c0_seq1:268-1362(+)
MNVDFVKEGMAPGYRMVARSSDHKLCCAEDLQTFEDAWSRRANDIMSLPDGRMYKTDHIRDELKQTFSNGAVKAHVISVLERTPQGEVETTVEITFESVALDAAIQNEDDPDCERALQQFQTLLTVVDRSCDDVAQPLARSAAANSCQLESEDDERDFASSSSSNGPGSADDHEEWNGRARSPWWSTHWQSANWSSFDSYEGNGHMDVRNGVGHTDGSFDEKGSDYKDQRQWQQRCWKDSWWSESKWSSWLEEQWRHRDSRWISEEDCDGIEWTCQADMGGVRSDPCNSVDDSQSLKLKAVSDCPGGHGLHDTIIEETYVLCSLCEESVKGMLMYQCLQCGYQVCHECRVHVCKFVYDQVLESP